MKIERPKKYAILCTRQNGETYYAYSMMMFNDKEKAQGEADYANKIWGNEIHFEVVEI